MQLPRRGSRGRCGSCPARDDTVARDPIVEQRQFEIANGILDDRDED